MTVTRNTVGLRRVVLKAVPVHQQGPGLDPSRNLNPDHVPGQNPNRGHVQDRNPALDQDQGLAHVRGLDRVQDLGRALHRQDHRPETTRIRIFSNTPKNFGKVHYKEENNMTV